MRARHVIGMLGLLGCTASFACLPATTQDFDDYQTRAHAFVGPSSDGGATIEAGTKPTDAQNDLFVATCLTELANGQVSLAFTFGTMTAFTPAAGGGGTLSVVLQPQTLVNGKPPTTYTKANNAGPALPAIAGTTDASDSFAFSLGAATSITLPGSTNPITVGADAVLSNPGLAGVFATDHWCARLTGNVVQPAAAARTLDESKNFCIFDTITEGAPIPAHKFADFSVANCPL